MTTKEFIKYAGERPELCVEINGCNCPEEAYALAQREGLTDDMAAFIAEMKAAHDECEEISNEDLVNIQAAGTNTAGFTISVSAVSVTAAAAASSAGI